MKRHFRLTILFLCLAACEPGRGTADDAAAAAAGNEATANKAGETLLPPCPFRNTRGWAGSIEGGRLLVTGNVDLQMAGFRPTLAERESAPAGTLGLDLTLAPEPNAAVTDLARYERSGVRGYRRGEIWCGGTRLATFDIVNVG